MHPAWVFFARIRADVPIRKYGTLWDALIGINTRSVRCSRRAFLWDKARERRRAQRASALMALGAAAPRPVAIDRRRAAPDLIAHGHDRIASDSVIAIFNLATSPA
jgi:hypothetical protein